MGRRFDLHEKLVAALGTKYVYFQPPESIKMTYPCIVYSRDAGFTDFADDAPYKTKMRYQITVIDQDPDSDIPSRVAKLPMTLFSQHFTADNLNHDVYNTYF